MGLLRLRGRRYPDLSVHDHQATGREVDTPLDVARVGTLLTAHKTLIWQNIHSDKSHDSSSQPVYLYIDAKPHHIVTQLTSQEAGKEEGTVSFFLPP